MLAGERVVLGGRLVPVADRPDLAVRHVAARLLVDEVGAAEPGDVVSRVANGLRRAVVGGAGSLGPDATALLTGICFGDDRAQAAAVRDDFRAAGLTHLLAVSGQNVVFVLLVAGPLLRRLGLGSRLVTVLVLLGFFALLTRFEPSVLRATAMAGIAAVHQAAGRPSERARTLALAVTVLLLVDPVLVRSVGFALSVGATAGILAWAPGLTARLPGPRWLAEPLAVTLAAQVAVAPLLVLVFGGVPLVALPANLLAGPAAGLVMAWGLVAGPLAGLLVGAAPAAGGVVAAALHVPDRLALAWLHAVAERAGAVPLGELGAPHLFLLAVAVGTAWWVRRGDRRPVALAVAGAVGVATLAAPGLVLARRPPLIGREVATGAEVWRAGDAVVVRLDGRARAGPVLAGLRRVGVRRVGLVLVSGSSASDGDLVEALTRRARPAVASAAEDERLVVGPFTAEALAPGRWLVRIAPGAAGSVRSAGARRARPPPLRRHPPAGRGRRRWGRGRPGGGRGRRRGARP